MFYRHRDDLAVSADRNMEVDPTFLMTRAGQGWVALIRLHMGCEDFAV
jgi:hypothetical protein